MSIASGHNLCPRYHRAVELVGKRWTGAVVRTLMGGPRRFNELKRMIGGISQRMLTLTLRGLERDGLITRTVYPTVPPRVDYELTALGRSLLQPVSALGDWARRNRGRIEEALAGLSENHRAILLLREVGGLSYGDLARVLGIRKGTVMSRLFHARLKMQNKLREYLGEDAPKKDETEEGE